MTNGTANQRRHLLIVGILVSTITFGGCANNVYKHDGSLPPLDRQTQIPMNRLLPGDQLQQHQLAYVELEDNQTIPPDGTIELFREKIGTRRAGAPTWVQYTLAPIWPLIVLPVAIVALPFIAAHEFSRGPDAKAADSASEAQPAINEIDLRREKERTLSREKHVQWLASAVIDGQWSSTLDDAYISDLNQALGWKAPPLKGSAEQYRQLRLFSGISRIVLLDSKLGERTLILCARTSVDRAGVAIRYFETCQSGNIGSAMSYDSPASSEALRAVLVEQARNLSALQAKALTEQSEFVQAKW